MSCYYWVNNIQLPPERLERVDALLQEHGLSEDYPMVFSKELSLLSMEDSNMGYDTSSSLDNFLSDLAGVLDGTAQDGQVVSWDYEGESKGVFVFLQGTLHIVYAMVHLLGTTTRHAGVHTIAGELDVIVMPDGVTVVTAVREAKGG